MTKHSLLPTVTAALVLLGAALTAPQTAHADTYTLSGDLSIGQTAGTGNEPTIDGSSYSITDQGFTIPGLAGGTIYGPTELFSISPAGSSGCGSCTVSDTISVTFSGLSDGTSSSIQNSYTYSGTYEAKYGGTALPCSDSGNGDTDCFDWAGAGSSPTGSVLETIMFGDGASLDLTLANASDWTIYPEISAEFFAAQTGQQSPVPEPASMILFASSLGGLPVIRRRLSRKTAPAAA
jgi:hypothetical protein